MTHPRDEAQKNSPDSSGARCILCNGKPVGRGAFIPRDGGAIRWYSTCARHAPNRPGVARLIELALADGVNP